MLTHHRPTGFPVFPQISMCTLAVATTPAGSLNATTRLVQRCQPPRASRRVGPRIGGFEVFSAFTRVTACVLAESLS